MQSELQEARDDLKERAQLLATREAELKILDGHMLDSEMQMEKEIQRMKYDQNALQEVYHKVSLLTLNIVLLDLACIHCSVYELIYKGGG